MRPSLKKTLSGNPSLIRDINRSAMLDLIRRQGPISQAEIAKIMEVQPSTILRITKELEEGQLIVRSGQGTSGSKGGRKATLLELNPAGALAVGVDLGADQIRTVLIDLTGNMMDEVVSECPSDQGADRVMETVKQSVRQLLPPRSPIREKVLGIGVAIPGHVDSASGVSIKAANFADWNRVPVAGILEGEFGLPAFLDHDMRLMALGEQWLGENARNMLCIGFRRGIGLGMVLGGELYRGEHHFAGDLGHTVVDSRGPACDCGRRGCLEAVASEGSIIRDFQAYLASHPEDWPPLLEEPQKELNLSTVLGLLRDNHPVLVQYVREAGARIGQTLANLVRIFDPEKLVIGGEIVHANPAFIEAIQESYHASQSSYPSTEPDVRLTRLGNRSIAFGAGIAILSSLFLPGKRLQMA